MMAQVSGSEARYGAHGVLDRGREPPPPLAAKREGHLAACHFR